LTGVLIESKIATSSVAPLAARLSQLFSPRLCIFVSAVVFSLGGLVASQAKTFSTFIAGRAISGVGAAGILTISIILVLELTDKKRRGVFFGLVNAGYTTGIALGAVVAGALVGRIGWVSDDSTAESFETDV
jgi:MFS family permease